MNFHYVLADWIFHPSGRLIFPNAIEAFPMNEAEVIASECPTSKHPPKKSSPAKSVQSPVFGPPFKLVSGDAFSAPSAVLPKVQEVDNSEQNVV